MTTTTTNNNNNSNNNNNNSNNNKKVRFQLKRSWIKVTEVMKNPACMTTKAEPPWSTTASIKPHVFGTMGCNVYILGVLMGISQGAQRLINLEIPVLVRSLKSSNVELG